MSSSQTSLSDEDIKTIESILDKYNIGYKEENTVDIRIGGYDFDGKHYRRNYIQVN